MLTLENLLGLEWKRVPDEDSTYCILSVVCRVALPSFVSYYHKLLPVEKANDVCLQGRYAESLS